MLAKIAIVFVGIITAGVLLNVYYAIFAFFTVFLLGIDSETVFTVQYWICFAGAAASSFWLMWKIWPKAPRQQKVEKSETE